MKIHQIFLTFIIMFVLLNSCGGWNPQSSREQPVSGPERARKNVEEGRGVSIKGLVGGRNGATNYEFSTSNPMWRAAFEVIDFMPLTTVDYSGGTIITDWYSDNRSPNESLKFTIRFLSSEIRADSVKVIIHRKICGQKDNCTIKKISSKLEGEIRTAIVKKAALMDRMSEKGNKKKDKNKKKKTGWFGLGGESAEDIAKSDKKIKSDSGKQ